MQHGVRSDDAGRQLAVSPPPAQAPAVARRGSRERPCSATNECATPDSIQSTGVSQHDHVAFPPNGADQSLGKSVLPRAPGRGEHFGDAHFSQAVPELVAIDSVAVSDQVLRCTIFGKRFPNLLNSPNAVGCSVTLKCTRRRRRCANTTSTKRTRKVAVGTVKKSMETSSPTCRERSSRFEKEVDAFWAGVETRFVPRSRYRASATPHGCGARPTAGWLRPSS